MHQPPVRRRLHLLAVALLAGGLVGGGVYEFGRPNAGEAGRFWRVPAIAVPPGQTIERFGDYRSADALTFMSVKSSVGGKATLTFSSPSRRSRPEITSEVAITFTFDPNERWFIIEDEAGRFWHYTKATGHAFTKFSDVPDGGLKTTVPGELCCWTGVPETFVERLPKDLRVQFREGIAAATRQ